MKSLCFGCFLSFFSTCVFAAPQVEQVERYEELSNELEVLEDSWRGAREQRRCALLRIRQVEILSSMTKVAPDYRSRLKCIRKLAEALNEAILNGAEKEGLSRLRRLSEHFEKAQDLDVLAYLEYVRINVEHSLAFEGRKLTPAEFDVELSRVVAEYYDEIEKFVERFPHCPKATEMLLDLAAYDELSGFDDKAKEKYRRIIHDFPVSSSKRRAVGAIRRLDNVGKTVEIKGKSPSGDVVRLLDYRGKHVLVVFWTLFVQPPYLNESELDELKRIYARFAGDNFEMLFVCTVQRTNMPRVPECERLPFPWPTIIETMHSERGLTRHFGIAAVPTVFLVDKDGKLVNQYCILRNSSIYPLKGRPFRKVVRLSDVAREIATLLGNKLDPQ